ncbi:MAG: hypothetical protein ABFD89_10380 [Bryobacteraceae bacterium]
MPDRPDCPYCDGTGWRYVNRGCTYTAVEPCDHQPPKEPPVDRKTRASGEERSDG